MSPGDVYDVWVEVDPSFPSDLYEILWFVRNKPVGRGLHFSYEVTIRDVSSVLFIEAELRTHREWHLSDSR